MFLSIVMRIYFVMVATVSCSNIYIEICVNSVSSVFLIGIGLVVVLYFSGYLLYRVCFVFVNCFICVTLLNLIVH